MESQEDSDTPKEILLNMLDFEGRGEEGILNILQASGLCAPPFVCSLLCLLFHSFFSDWEQLLKLFLAFSTNRKFTVVHAYSRQT